MNKALNSRESNEKSQIGVCLKTLADQISSQKTTTFRFPWEANDANLVETTQIPFFIGQLKLRTPFSNEVMRLFQKKVPVLAREKGLFKVGSNGFCPLILQVLSEIQKHYKKQDNVNEVLINTFWAVLKPALKKQVGFDLELLQTKSFAEALKDLKSAADKHPAWAASLIGIAILYLERNKVEAPYYDEAMKIFKQRFLLEGLICGYSQPLETETSKRIFELTPLDKEEKSRLKAFCVNVFPSLVLEGLPEGFSFEWKEVEMLLGSSLDEYMKEVADSLPSETESEAGKAESEPKSEKRSQEEQSIIQEEHKYESVGMSNGKEKQTPHPKADEFSTSQLNRAEARATEESVNKPIHDFFPKSRTEIQRLIQEYLNTHRAYGKVEVKRKPQTFQEEGKLFTGFLNIKESGVSKFLNFYPKYVWENDIPVPLSEERLKYEFPDFGSFLLVTAPNERRKYQFLQSGALINIRLRKDLSNVFNDSRGKLTTHFQIALHDLVKNNDICLSSQANPDHQAFFVARSLTGSTVDNLSLQQPLGAEYSKELTEPIAMIECSSNQFVGPVKLEKKGVNSFSVSESVKIGRGSQKIQSKFIVKNVQALSAFTQRSPEEKPTTYEVLFTGPRFCNEYLIDQADENTGLQDLLELIRKQSEAIEGVGRAIEEVTNLYSDDPALETVLQARFNQLLRKSSGYYKQDKFFYLLTEVVLTRWAEIGQAETSRGEALLDRLLSADKIARRILEIPAIGGEISAQKAALQQDVEELEKERSQKQNSLKSLSAQEKVLSKRCSELNTLGDLQEEISAQRKEQSELLKNLTELKKQNKKARDEYEKFEHAMNLYESRLDNLHAKAAELYMDREIGEWIFKDRQNSARNETSTDLIEKSNHWKKKYQALSQVCTEFTRQDELVSNLVSRIQEGRNYPHNEIINLLTCISTGFLTVFAGTPGCGKTTLSDIIGTAFGLNSLQGHPAVKTAWGERADIANRYLSVAVERGWTSKRDFIGYYNPINDSFECGDPQRYEFLKILDHEARTGQTHLPYLVLLDEANLSPMEYYFADFMNLGEGRGKASFVALGDHYRYQVGSNLRFIATINTDHTTERLSPRLLDRSWIITLPEERGFESARNGQEIEPSMPIDWELFHRAFSTADKEGARNRRLKTLNEITSLLEAVKNKVSRRSIQAVLDYTGAATRWMHGVNESEVENLALDYAISQRLLPQIDVFGNFEKELQELQKYFEDHDMPLSANVIGKILSSGEELKGYSFF